MDICVGWNYRSLKKTNFSESRCSRLSLPYSQVQVWQAREKEDSDKYGQVVALWHSCVWKCAVLNWAPNAQGHTKPLVSVKKLTRLWAPVCCQLVLEEIRNFCKSWLVLSYPHHYSIGILAIFWNLFIWKCQHQSLLFVYILLKTTVLGVYPQYVSSCLDPVGKEKAVVKGIQTSKEIQLITPFESLH